MGVAGHPLKAGEAALERLQARNEFLITSHQPLRETLILQTGATEPARRACLQKAWTEARDVLIHAWRPATEEALALVTRRLARPRRPSG